MQLYNYMHVYYTSATANVVANTLYNYLPVFTSLPMYTTLAAAILANSLHI